jgi:hypothetical protein
MAVSLLSGVGRVIDRHALSGTMPRFPNREGEGVLGYVKNPLEGFSHTLPAVDVPFWSSRSHADAEAVKQS